MLCAKFDLNWPSVSEEKEFIFPLCIVPLFLYYIPSEKGMALHLNKLESPIPKNALCQVWVKLAQWFSRRRISNFVNVFSLFGNYLPLVKGCGPSFE